MRPLRSVPDDPQELAAFLRDLPAAPTGPAPTAAPVTAPDTRPNPVLTGPALAVTTPGPSLRRAPVRPQALTLRLALRGVRPPVWRRLQVAGDTTMDRLHTELSLALGWTDPHRHRFRTGPGYDAPHLLDAHDVAVGRPGLAEADVRVDQLLHDHGDVVWCEHDGGDGWDHELRLERTDPLPPGRAGLPRLVAGRLACPPEQCGGPTEYADLAAWVRAGRPADDLPPPYDSVDRLRRRLADDWDPDAFDVEAADRRLRPDEQG